MKLPKIIGVYAPAPQSGKSSVAGFLVEEHGFERIPFAKILKLMCRPLFEALGYSIVDIIRFETGDKTDLIDIGETNADGLPVMHTVRHFYKTLGDGWGRTLIGQKLWITAWSRAVDTALNGHHFPGIVADDMRYPNELATVRELGGQGWAVRRPGYTPADDHPSEGQLQFENADFCIENDGTYEDLMANLNTSWSTR